MTDRTDDDGARTVAGPLTSDESIPSWLRSLTDNVDGVTDSVNNRGGDRTRLLALTRKRSARPASVLVLFGGSFDAAADGTPPVDADVLLTQRANTLRNHPGQVAFPGGAVDPGDDYPVGTALREAQEETGLDPDSVVPVAQLRSFPVPPSGFDVVPVIAHWPTPSPVRAVDQGETARVARVPLRDLLSPDNRFQVQRSVMGGRVYRGPAFWVEDMLVWGFTGGLLAAIFETAGWDVPWDTDDVRDLGDMLDRAGQR
ncbi:NUDIX hydrolase [Williamsia maris]|uniref:NUDIX domain-containing protein n=1 Tax=Williamsia maris TaxID=72806 RepID=A0ABT1HB58_9NOCA|nr:CoA pyrophosphatase [Williamsia maris]MCP2175484.1 NUDIX domain-containing protein [Williamsia maris]